MQKMKAIIYQKRGAEKLVYTDVEKPVPKENEVLIKVVASSVNAADYRSMRLGIVPKRKIFGADVAGRVELVGRSVSLWKEGDEVMGDLSGSGFGCFAEYTVAPEDKVIQKPVELSFAEAAAVPLAAITAIQALRGKGKIQKGQKVLIVGSGGGVGTFTVQLARYFGAEITAVCSTRNAEQSRMLGAQTVIDYTQENFTRTRQRFDLILAVNGNEALLTYRRLLAPGGTYLMVGGSMTQILKSLLFGKLLSLGRKKMLAVSAKANMADLEFIAALAAKGQIKPVIDRTYTLEQMPEAMEYANTGHAQGKLLIKVE
ncbi:NAD(P)-dependent alcohol dehydrogenase [Maribellus maritimus]|uniref:NAD(P)-dependent alcohol dehydrogenase n=1 Tax=Maribellus maritimus TaxID=2870838 RepID=UPI001EEC8FD8|nr:NAD(P)-dependent alcohol dehydrogenase [Maribellus maritimus]MCG6186565.1 NAD(P)-dependent alcohol dehydrogenase [Maribellus maritimus]